MYKSALTQTQSQAMSQAIPSELQCEGEGITSFSCKKREGAAADLVRCITTCKKVSTCWKLREIKCRGDKTEIIITETNRELLTQSNHTDIMSRNEKVFFGIPLRLLWRSVVASSLVSALTDFSAASVKTEITKYLKSLFPAIKCFTFLSFF